MQKFYVEYNCRLMAIYKTLRAALNFVQRKGYRNDELNMVRIFDNLGEHYDTDGDKIDID